VTQPATTEAVRSRSGLLPKTLTGRLVWGVVALVVMIIAMTSVSTYVAMRVFLFHRLDQQLRTTAVQNADAVNNSSPTGRGTTVTQGVFSGQRVWLALLEPNGSARRLVIEPPARRQFVALELNNRQSQRFVAHPATIVPLDLTDGTRLRVESLPLNDGSFLVVGLSAEDAHRTMRQVMLSELAIGLAVIALAAGLTAWGVQAGLAPLHRVTRTAREITAELGPDGRGLDRRVPGADPDTEVGQVSTAVNTLLGAVETQFAARVASEVRMRQFLADASHELRTPLTSIRGYAELSRLQGQSSGELDDPMSRIETEGTRMSRLVDDLLVLTRGDQGAAPVREPVGVDTLIDEALSGVSSAHPTRTFERGPHLGLEVIGDRDQLVRVLLNLLTNAAVHTAPDGPIVLEAGPGHLPFGPAVELRVRDCGPGMPPEEAAHVFERFWRADKARTRAKGGSGLGMAIVAQIVHSHGGTVRFDSSVAHGTTVTVTLPLATAPASVTPQ